jgi:hypothetical protein
MRWKEVENITYYVVQCCKNLKFIEFRQDAEIEDVEYKKKGRRKGGGGELEKPRNTGFRNVNIKCF